MTNLDKEKWMVEKEKIKKYGKLNVERELF